MTPAGDGMTTVQPGQPVTRVEYLTRNNKWIRRVSGCQISGSTLGRVINYRPPCGALGSRSPAANEGGAVANPSPAVGDQRTRSQVSDFGLPAVRCAFGR